MVELERRAHQLAGMKPSPVRAERPLPTKLGKQVSAGAELLWSVINANLTSEREGPLPRPGTSVRRPRTCTACGTRMGSRVR
jgi:hypothetical protein